MVHTAVAEDSKFPLVVTRLYALTIWQTATVQDLGQSGSLT